MKLESSVDLFVLTFCSMLFESLPCGFPSRCVQSAKQWKLAIKSSQHQEESCCSAICHNLKLSHFGLMLCDVMMDINLKHSSWDLPFFAKFEWNFSNYHNSWTADLASSIMTVNRRWSLCLGCNSVSQHLESSKILFHKWRTFTEWSFLAYYDA